VRLGSVNLAGKRGSRPNSTTSFSENVVVAGTSYQMPVEVLAFCNRGRAQTPSITITFVTFLVKKKYNDEFRGVYFLTIREKTLNQIPYS